MPLKALRMPERLRPILAKGIGTIIEGVDPLATATKAAQLLTGCRLIVAVGDIVCSSMKAAGVSPDICVVDGKTKRKFMGYLLDDGDFDTVLTARNPAGHITGEAYERVREAIKAALSGSRVAVMVDGEEDLLAIPAIIEAPEGSCIIYGMPNVGVGLIFVSEDEKKDAEKLIQDFEPVEIGGQ